MKRSLVFLLPLAIFAGISWFLYQGLYHDPRELPSPLIEKAAPDFRVESLETPGRMVDRKDMLGQVWLLNTWASWCVACREEHPLLVEFSKTATIPIVGLNYKDERSAGMRWLTQLGNPYVTSAFDQSGRIGIDYGVYGVPESFLIDKHGIIRYKLSGPVTPEFLENTLLPLIARLKAQA